MSWTADIERMGRNSEEEARIGLPDRILVDHLIPWGTSSFLLFTDLGLSLSGGESVRSADLSGVEFRPSSGGIQYRR